MATTSYAPPRDTALYDNAVPGATQDILTIAEDATIVTAIERFAVAVERQDDAVADAMAHLTSVWMAIPAFIGAIVLRGRENGGLAIYAQWRKPDDGAFPATPQGDRSMASALAGHEMLDSRNYALEFTSRAAGAEPPTRVSITTTPLAHFGLFTVDPGNIDELMRRARDDAPHSLKVPGIVAINFHRSVDRCRVVNLGLWTSFSAFAALIDQPGFADGNEYFRDLADFQPDYLDVVAIKVGAG